MAEVIKEENTETELFKLFLLSGYITKTKFEGQYRIPNNEVRSYFYKEFFPVWIEANFEIQEEFHPSTLAASLANNLENLKLYIQLLQDNLLSKLQPNTRSEASFQGLLGGFAMLAEAELPNPKHSVYSEYITYDLKRLDSLFAPFPDRSSTWIIHEYKKLDSSNGFLQTMENAFWQIYAQRYLGAVFENANLRYEFIYCNQSNCIL